MQTCSKTLFTKLRLGAAGVALLATSQAYAATLVTVTPPAGAVATTVFGINDHGVIAGSYVDSAGVEHGFTGPLNGTYTTFDYGGTSIGTEPRALNDDGDITGFAGDPSFAVGAEFLRDAKKGTISTFEKDGIPLDGIAQGITRKKDTSTGDYIDPNTGIRTGYLGKNGDYQSDVDLGLGAIRTSPRGINKHGTLAGFYVDSGGVTHGFILGKSGVPQVIDADASGTTSLEGINKKELVTGQVTDSSGNIHSFLYDNATGTFTTIDIPDGSTLQQAWGINDQGQVAVSTDVATYIYCTRDNHCPDGGTAIADGRSWRLKPGASLIHDRHGRTTVHARKSPSPVRGARQ
jgi:uncharacterized membrane protein